MPKHNRSGVDALNLSKKDKKQDKSPGRNKKVSIKPIEYASVTRQQRATVLHPNATL
jgi:hypothetical protein